MSLYDRTSGWTSSGASPHLWSSFKKVHQNYVPPDSVYSNVDKAERKADRENA